MLFGKKITKILTVEGMHCMHCAKATEMALKGIQGVSGVKVELETKKVTVTSRAPLDDEILRQAVSDAGFEVVDIQ